MCIKLGIMDKCVGFVSFFTTLTFKLWPDFNINEEGRAACFIEIINKESKNILISTQYGHLSSAGKKFEEYLNDTHREKQ